MNKEKKIIGISFSTAILNRTRCKFCKEFPSKYFMIGSVRTYKDVRKFINFFDWIKENCFRMCSDFYLLEDPSNIISAANFAFSPSYKSYNPNLHNKIGIVKNNYTDCLTCSCSKTFWFFKQKANINRIEIVNRKSNKEYLKKFSW